ncbi:hypothetical protein KP509_03G081100 [Ceratopteris richardii]|uniref:Uncharacterized protein n=1 Tax=Ceratopteris richardii TaxID=49495 RepID=A0A8T2V9D1_CERRI|nr:hypothetical protein KP509_03G081100 [Ceratopteris richardii]
MTQYEGAKIWKVVISFSLKVLVYIQVESCVITGLFRRAMSSILLIRISLSLQISLTLLINSLLSAVRQDCFLLQFSIALLIFLLLKNMEYILAVGIQSRFLHSASS